MAKGKAKTIDAKDTTVEEFFASANTGKEAVRKKSSRLKKGQGVLGTLVSIDTRTGKDGKDFKVYTLENDKGALTVAGAPVLDSLMEEVPTGAMVAILRLDKDEATGTAGRAVGGYRVKYQAE